LDRIFKARKDASAQIIGEELEDSSGLIEPFFNIDALLGFYYANAYHRRAIELKANLLSNVEDGAKLENATDGNPKRFLQGLILNLELFGSAYVEIARDRLYILPSAEARVDKERRVWQYADRKKVALEAKQLAYYSPRSRFYGEPDYLAAIAALNSAAKIDAFNAAFFDNSARADKAIIFEGAEPTTEQMDAFRDFFSGSFKGFYNAHKTLIVSAGGENAKVRFEDLSKTDDLSFKELKNIIRDEVIAAHGVPPRMIGVMSASQLGGGGELIGQLHAFNELTIKPKQEIVEWFFETLGYPIKLKPIDVSNYKDDAMLVAGLVQSGVLSVQEARATLGY
jgi:HK97 family phage portal protein